MTVRDNIAANLRALCAERGSIAQCCREAGINRQQFNRYITGEAIPNRANLQKICGYFGITETELFQATDEAAEQHSMGRLFNIRGCNPREVIDNLNAGPEASIQDGTYFVYYRMPTPQPSIARSVMFIRTDGKQKTFRRITNIASHGAAKWRYFQGDHKGIVLERRNWLNFIGLSEQGADEPSMITAQRVEVLPPMYVGTALVYGIAAPLALPVVLEPLDADVTHRRAIRGCGIMAMGSPEVRPIIKDFLETQHSKITI